MKTIPGLASIPVIIVSAEEPVVAQARALAAGAVAFLQKPVAQHTLISKVKEALVASRETMKKSL